MLKIKKVILKDATILNNEEMKHIFGGISSRNSDECSGPEETCDSSKSCLVGGTESGHCEYTTGPGCHCQIDADGSGGSGSGESM